MRKACLLQCSHVVGRRPRWSSGVLKRQGIGIGWFTRNGTVGLLRTSSPKVLGGLLQLLDVGEVFFFILAFGNNFHRAEVFALDLTWIANLLLLRVRPSCFI